jgi:hypothetical protein
MKSCTYITIALFVLMFGGFFPANSVMADDHLAMTANITEENDGSIIDVAVGASLNILLKVPPQEIYKASCLWSKVTTSSDVVLQVVQKAILLPTGITAASFRALRAGIVQLNSSRHNCSTGIMIDWYVTIRVT